jgi:hypothetical protein
MNDVEILQHIEELVNEEHSLTQQSQRGGLDPEGHERMHKLEVSLDQCWDLLRQRRALRANHLNPDTAVERDADIVEHYKQ